MLIVVDFSKAPILFLTTAVFRGDDDNQFVFVYSKVDLRYHYI